MRFAPARTLGAWDESRASNTLRRYTHGKYSHEMPVCTLRESRIRIERRHCAYAVGGHASGLPTGAWLAYPLRRSTGRADADAAPGGGFAADYLRTVTLGTRSGLGEDAPPQWKAACSGFVRRLCAVCSAAASRLVRRVAASPPAARPDAPSRRRCCREGACRAYPAVGGSGGPGRFSRR
jgi:hypothetical protein